MYLNRSVERYVQILFTAGGLYIVAGKRKLNTKKTKNYIHNSYIINRVTNIFSFSCSAVCGTIALVIFGIHGDSRVWMPHWEHNDIGWSYGVAVAGTIALFISGVLFVIEGRVHQFKREKIVNQHANYDYDVDDRKQSSHTDI